MSAIYVQSTGISDGMGTEFFKLVRGPLLLKILNVITIYKYYKILSYFVLSLKLGFYYING